MILVDSSVWIDFFNARQTRQTAFLTANLTDTRLATADLVFVEVIQGARDDRTAVKIERLLRSLDIVVVSDIDIAVQAARHYRTLRAKGITIRKTIDTLIATRCIVDNHQLLFADRDFEPFVDHFGLRGASLYFGTN